MMNSAQAGPARPGQGVYDDAGQPVEVQDSVAAGDRHTFCFEVDMR